MGSRTTFRTSWVQNPAIMVYASHIFLRKGTIWKNLNFLQLHNASGGQMPSCDLKSCDIQRLSPTTGSWWHWTQPPLTQSGTEYLGLCKSWTNILTPFKERIASTGSSIFWLPRSLQPQRVIQGTKTSQLNTSDTLVGWGEIEKSSSTCSLKIQIYNHSMMTVILLTVFAQQP